MNTGQIKINSYAINFDSNIIATQLYLNIFFVTHYIMFSEINEQLDFYIYIYKNIQLQAAFKDYLNKKISYNDFYDNYNKDYMNLIKVHNKLLYYNNYV